MNSFDLITLNSNRSLTNNKGRRNCPSCKPRHIPVLSTDLSSHTLITVKNKPQLTYEEYVGSISTSMQKYQTEFNQLDKSNEEELKDKCLSVEDEYLIKKVYNANHNRMTKNLNSFNSDSTLKVTIPVVKYLNPYQSIKILKKNNKIVSSLNQEFLQRQKELFDDAIISFESYTMKYKVKMPKIKVCNAYPKITNEIPVIDKTDAGKKKKEIIFPLIPNIAPRLFAYYRYPNKNFPEGREQFTLCVHENRIVLVGGISSQMKVMSLWKLDLFSLQWEKIQQKNFSSSRFGHTCVCYQNKLFLFGGRTKYANSSLFTGFDIFSLNDSYWITSSASKSMPKFRRNHVSDLIGTCMIIHGGVCDSGEILSDTYLLNFNPLKWVQCSIDLYYSPPALYGHTSAVVLPGEMMNNNKFSIYKFPETGLANDNYSKVTIFNL